MEKALIGKTVPYIISSKGNDGWKVFDIQTLEASVFLKLRYKFKKLIWTEDYFLMTEIEQNKIKDLIILKSIGVFSILKKAIYEHKEDEIIWSRKDKKQIIDIPESFTMFEFKCYLKEILISKEHKGYIFLYECEEEKFNFNFFRPSLITKDTESISWRKIEQEQNISLFY